MSYQTTNTEAPKLGEGVYFPIDVSQILKLPYHQVKYMMKTYWHATTFGDKGNKAINFYALIEFYTYYNLRKKGYTSPAIKKLHTQLSKVYNTPYPFASIEVLTPKKIGKKSKIWYKYQGNIIKGDGKQQPSIQSFVKPFLKQIEFGEDLLAKRFYPLYHTENIVVDPLHQFGKPVINGTNIQTKTISALINAGESKQNVCILYDISEKQVNDAIRLHIRKAA
jgi:uncharacterized protein (DUF433 family)